MPKKTETSNLDHGARPPAEQTTIWGKLKTHARSQLPPSPYRTAHDFPGTITDDKKAGTIVSGMPTVNLALRRALSDLFLQTLFGAANKQGVTLRADRDPTGTASINHPPGGGFFSMPTYEGVIPGADPSTPRQGEGSFFAGAAAALPTIAAGITSILGLKNLFGGGGGGPQSFQPSPITSGGTSQRFMPMFNDQGSELMKFLSLFAGQTHAPQQGEASPASGGAMSLNGQAGTGLPVPNMAWFDDPNSNADMVPPGAERAPLYSAAWLNSAAGREYTTQQGQAREQEAAQGPPTVGATPPPSTSGAGSPSPSTGGNAGNPMSSLVDLVGDPSRFQEILRTFSLPTFSGPTGAGPTPLQRQSTDYLSELMKSDPGGSQAAAEATLKQMLETGAPFDTTAQSQALDASNAQDLSKQVAQLREMFGQRGLRFGSDIARGEGTLRAESSVGNNLNKANIAAQSYEAAAGRRMNALTIPDQLRQARVALGLDIGNFAENDRAAQERNIERQMAEFARTQGALFPLILQFALSGFEGDTLIPPVVTV